jgi:hypothetical protein
MNNPEQPLVDDSNPSVHGGSLPPKPSPMTSQNRLRRRALRLATELCDLSPGQWLLCSVGADAPIVSLDDEPVIAEAIGEARILGHTRPAPGHVRSQAGVGGLVVAAHGRDWSLVARSGGPVLVLCAQYPDGARLDTDSSPELGVLVAELIAVSRDYSPGGSGTVRNPI